MLEQQEKQFTKEQAGLDEKQLFQKNINDFIEVIPEKGPLNDKSEMREMTTRAITFGQLYNQLSAISVRSTEFKQRTNIQDNEKSRNLEEGSAFLDREN